MNPQHSRSFLSPAVSILLVAVFSLALGTTTARADSIITNTWISKSVWYTQKGSNSSDLVLEPSQPYSFIATAQCDKNAATNIVSASLRVGSGSLPMIKALSLGENVKGALHQSYFKDKLTMDTAFPSGSNVVIAVDIKGTTNYFTNSIPPDVYPPIPLISIASNGAWSSKGYIIILDRTKPLTISWPSVHKPDSSLTIYSRGDFSGFYTNLSNTTYSFDPSLIAQLPEDTITPVLLYTSRTNDAYNSFAIFVPPTPWSGNPSILLKTHSFVQTGPSTLSDYVSPTAGAGDFYTLGYGPYNFSVSNPSPVTLTTPINSQYEAKIGLQAGGYCVDSGPLTLAGLNAAFPNGEYSYSTGQRLSLSGDFYPTAPRIVSVNGKKPQWKNGMLELNAAQKNCIVWSSFSGYKSFSECGIQDVVFAPAFFADWESLTAPGRGSTNLTVCPAAAIGDGKLITKLNLPARLMETNVNYTLSILYGALTSITNSPCISGAAFATRTIVPIIAK